MDEAEFLDTDPFIDEPKFSVYSVPVIVPLLIFLLTLMYAGYVIDSVNQQGLNLEQGSLDHLKTSWLGSFLPYLKEMSLGIFLLSQTWQLIACLYSQSQLNGFLRRYPVIQNQDDLETLKPLIRTNMYFVPSVLLFIGLAIPTGIICLWQNGPVQAGIVTVTWAITSVIGIQCSATEKKVRSLECATPQLEKALKRLSDSWVKRAFPDF